MEPTTTTSARQLDEARFREAFDAHGAAVLRYAASRVGPQLGEDVAAETFVEAWRTRARFDASTGSIEAWLLGIATHVIARKRRAERRWLRMCADAAAATAAGGGGDHHDLDARLDAQRRRPELARALRTLTTKERDPLLLQLLVGLTTDEIAAALGERPGTIRSRITRARARVARELSLPEPEGDDHGR